MFNLITLAILSAAVIPGAPGVATAAVRQEASCPAGTEQAHATLTRYLTGALYAAERERYGIPQIAPGKVRVLADSTDARVCGELNRSIGSGRYGRTPYRLAYFATDQYYFVTITTERAPGGPLRAGHHPPVVVLDRNLRAINLTVVEP